MGNFESVEVSGIICLFDKKPCSHVGDCDAVLGLGSGCSRSKKPDGQYDLFI